MIQHGSSPSPEWDVEWDYTQGLPSENGWTKSVTGTASETLNDDSVSLYANKSSASISLSKSSNAIGVFEVKFKLTQNNCNFQMTLATDTNTNTWLRIRAQYSSNYKGIYLANGSDGSIGNMTKLLNLTSTNYNKWHTVRLVLNGSTGDVYIDDNKVTNGVTTAEQGWAMSGVFVWASSAGSSSGATTKIESMKLKLGRI